MMTLHSLASNVMMFNLHMRIWSKVRAFAASFIRAYGVASAGCSRCPDQGKQVLQPAGYNLQTSGACEGERISLVRRPDSVYDVKSLDMGLAHGRFLLDRIEAPIAARLFPLRCDVPVEMYSRLRFPSHVRIIIK